MANAYSPYVPAAKKLHRKVNTAQIDLSDGDPDVLVVRDVPSALREVRNSVLLGS